MPRSTRPDDLHLEWLRTFLALLDTGSFSAAAESLHVTQPAVSKRIRALETAIDQPLFERLGRHIEPLPAAAVLATGAREVVARMLDTARALDDLQHGHGGSLRLAVSHHIALHRLPELIRARRRGPASASLELRFLESEQAVEAVERREADLALVTLPEPPSAAHETGVIWSERLVLAAMADAHVPDRASDPPRTDSPAADTDWGQWIRSRNWILPPPASSTLQRIQRTLEPDVLPAAQQSCPSIEILRALIETGMGIGFLPDDLVRAPLCRIGNPAWVVRRDLGWLRMRERPCTRIERDFCALASEQAHSQGSV